MTLKEIEELQQRIVDLETRVNQMNPAIGRSSDASDDYQRAIREMVNDKIMDSVWNNFFYTSAFTPFTLIVTTDTEGIERLRDTSGNLFLSTDRPSKFRCSFYFGNTGYGAGCTAYITTMHVRTAVGTVPILSNGAEFVGLKIVNNLIYLCTYDNKTGNEKLINTNKTIVLDETVLLEINFYPQERADFYINNKYIGTITQNLPSNNNPIIFYPILCSLKRSDALSHNLNIDYYEFIQERK